VQLVRLVRFEQVAVQPVSAASATRAKEASPVSMNTTVDMGSICWLRNSSTKSMPVGVSFPKLCSHSTPSKALSLNCSRASDRLVHWVTFSKPNSRNYDVKMDRVIGLPSMIRALEFEKSVVSKVMKRRDSWVKYRRMPRLH
jgi:hypothetical protein